MRTPAQIEAGQGQVPEAFERGESAAALQIEVGQGQALQAAREIGEAFAAPEIQAGQRDSSEVAQPGPPEPGAGFQIEAGQGIPLAFFSYG